MNLLNMVLNRQAVLLQMLLTNEDTISCYFISIPVFLIPKKLLSFIFCCNSLSKSLKPFTTFRS